MDKAQYLSTAVGSGGNGLFPLSTQGLNFIQNQINLLQAFAKIGGKRYILQQSTATASGYVVIDGEILPLIGNPRAATAIRVEETRENIVADGTTYKEARVFRVARYTSPYIPDVANLYPAAGFSLIQTNDALAKKFQEYTAVNSELAKKTDGNIHRQPYPSATGRTERQRAPQLPQRLCVALNGADEYTINVYRHSANNITQEQILLDLRRYVRYWDSNKKTWGGFFPVTENLHIDVKVVKGSTVYIRHGFIPEGVQLVLLRKKKRNRKRRSGGTTGTNPAWKGKSMLQQPKNQYAHYKGVILSTSSPNNWYVPKCIGVSDPEDNNLIDKEIGSICEPMIVVCGGSVQEIAAGKTFKSAGGEMVRMKYRLWLEQRDVYKQGLKVDKQTVVRRGFSVD